MDPDHTDHEQKIAYARASLWLPFYAVGMAARIRGDVPVELVKAALRKLQILYPPLASRVRVETDGSAWLTTEGVGEFPLEVRSKSADDDWTNLFLEQERIPFDFERGPVTRFFLLRDGETSDLVAVAPHVVCDGYSMTQVMCDAAALLNDPQREVTRPSPPPAVSWQTMPHLFHDHILLRGLVRVVNLTWPGSRLVLQQDGYEQLHRHYWNRQQNGMLTFKLSSTETSDLVGRCKRRGVSVTSALVAAFLLAQADVQPDAHLGQREISVPVNVRDRMAQLPGRAVGMYVSAVDLVVPARPGMPFWELARQGHTRIHRALRDRTQVLMPLVLEELDPSIADAGVAAFATDRWGPEFRLFTPFVKIQGDVRNLIISNIGRIDLPEVGSPYRLETLLPFPPLVPGSRMALNVLTVGGQLNAILKYRQDQMDGAAARIRDRALSYLASE